MDGGKYTANPNSSTSKNLSSNTSTNNTTSTSSDFNQEQSSVSQGQSKQQKKENLKKDSRQSFQQTDDMTEEEKKEAATAKAVDVAGETALDYFTGGQFSQIKNAASNIPIVGDKVNEEWNKAVSRVSKVVSKTPAGDMLKQADDSGITDMVRTAKDSINFSQGGVGDPAQAMNSSGNMPNMNSNPIGNTGNTPNLEISGDSLSNNSSSDSFGKGLDMGNSILGMPNYKIVVGIAIVLLLFLVICVTVFGQDDLYNLYLTNQSQMTSTSSGTRKCTQEEVENKLIYVGDSRISGLDSSIDNNNVEFVSDSNGNYTWFNTTGISNIEQKLQSDSNKIVVLSLGINDLSNIDNYIAAYKNLIAKYPTNIYIMSVNPVDESKTINVTNDEIEKFNKKLIDNFPNNYIDSYSNISNIVTSDGINYDLETNKSLNTFVVSNLSNSGKFICSSGTYDNISETSLSGGGGTLMKTNSSLISILGQEKINEWNNKIKSEVEAAGKGSGAAVSAAAYNLIQGALNEGLVLPYFWGGGHGIISDGVNGNWGSFQTVGVGGSNKQPKGSNHSSGLDCSGFVSWALKNGGCSNFTPIVAQSFTTLGNGIDISTAQAGDIAANSAHVMLILNNDGSSVIVAEAKSPSDGMQFNQYSYQDMKKYTIVSMSDYYANNCQS